MVDFKVYILFENLSITGKYVSNLYTADTVPGHDLVLPSGSETYTLPGNNEGDEKEGYIIKDVIAIGGTGTINYLEIWLNDKNSSDVIVLAVNTGATVNRQFEKMEYIIGEGTPIRFKQKE